MKDQNLTITFTVDQSPEEVFDAINNVRGWWSGEIDGRTDKLGEEWTYHYKDVHRTTQKITEFVPGKKVMRSNGRPIAQWSRLEAGRSDNLSTDPAQKRAKSSAGSGCSCESQS